MNEHDMQLFKKAISKLKIRPISADLTDKINQTISDRRQKYKNQCMALSIDEYGRSTMTYERRNKVFDL